MRKSKFIIEKLIASLILCGCLLLESTALVSASECELYGVQTLHLVSQPINCSVSVGSQASFTVKAEGTGLKYQWQVKFPNENWKNSGSTTATTATYSFTTEGEHNGMLVRCIVKDASGNSVTSNEAKCSTTAALKITGQPADCSVSVGKQASFTVKAEGTGLKYQWQVKFPNESWKNSGSTTATTATYSFTTEGKHNGMLVRCIVKDASGNSVTSNEAKCSTAEALRITGQPSNCSVSVGSQASFTVKAEGTGLKYQWQVKFPNENWKNSGSTTATTATYSFTTEGKHNGMLVRCIVKAVSGKSVTSNEAKCSTTAALKITGQPADCSVSVGKQASFMVKAEGTGLKYQWQVKFPNESWKNSGSTTATTATYSFTTEGKHNGMLVHCIVKDASGNSVTSSDAKVDIISIEDWELPIM